MAKVLAMLALVAFPAIWGLGSANAATPHSYIGSALVAAGDAGGETTVHGLPVHASPLVPLGDCGGE